MKILLLIDQDSEVIRDLVLRIKKLIPNNEFYEFRVGKNSIKHCIGCFKCWQVTPGECIIPDGGQDFAREFIRADMAIFLNPITFGGYSANIKLALDRILPNILPYFKVHKGEIHHQDRYDTYPPIIFFGLSSSPTDKKVFSNIVERNALNTSQEVPLELLLNKEEIDREFDSRFIEIYNKGVESYV